MGVALVVGLLSSVLVSCTLPGFVDEVVLSGLDQPMAVRFSPDGRVFVAEKRGVVKVFDGLGDPTATEVLDLRTEVYNQHDRGLMSIELHPDFPLDPRLYVLYSLDAEIGGTPPRWGQPDTDADPCPNPPGETGDGCVSSARLSQFSLVGNTAGPEQVMIEDWCQQFPSHTVGDVLFGPDGALYVSGGDGASYHYADYGQSGDPPNPCGDPPTGVGGTQTVPTAEGGALRAQDFRTTGDPQGLSGSIIRIDPDTAQGAPGNPAIGSPDPNLRRLIGAGVRNPFRMAFRPGTGELWFGDVGWNRWEELNRIEDATDSTIDNFGWPCLEGEETTGYDIGLDLCTGITSGVVPVVEPLLTYRQGLSQGERDRCDGTNGSSTSGVAFYPGGSYPDWYDSSVFYADYSRQCIWAVQLGPDGTPDPTTLRTFDDGVFPVDLQIGPNNDLFYVDIARGQVRRIRFEDGPQPPSASIAADPDSGDLPLTVDLSAAGSSTPGGGALSYAWDLDGDGQFDDATGVTTQITYTTAGAYTPAVRVTNGEGSSDTAATTVLAGTTRPVPTIDAPTSAFTWAVGDAIAFSGGAIDAEDGVVPDSQLSWDVIMHHCPTVDGCHEHVLTSVDGVGSGVTFAPDHDYPSYVELRLTAVDSSGVAGTTSVRLDPKVATVEVDTVPPGVPVTLSSETVPSPLVANVIEGTTLSLSVPAVHTAGLFTYAFSAWSDGQPRAHNIVVGPGTTTLTATYTQTGGPDPDLVAAYAFDEGSGSTAADATGRGHDGAVVGPTWSAGHSGGGLAFDGVDDLVTVADHADLDLTTGMTVEAWIRPDGAAGWQTAVLKESPAGLSYGLYAMDGSSLTPAGYVHDGADRAAKAPTALPAATWTHVAVTYDGIDVVLYVNAVEVGRQPGSGAIVPSVGALQIGGNTVWGEHLAGQLDDVRIYSRALTPAEIAADRNDPVG